MKDGTERREAEERVRELERRLAELQAQWPAHSVPTAMMSQLDELEDELAAARKELTVDKQTTWMTAAVLLRQIRDEGGVQSLWANLSTGGDLRLEGQDLGPGVEAVFGEGLTEYEYDLTVQADHVPALLAALGGETDVLHALQAYYRDPGAQSPASLLKAHDIPYEFWSRIGD